MKFYYIFTFIVATILSFTSKADNNCGEVLSNCSQCSAQYTACKIGDASALLKYDSCVQTANCKAPFTETAKAACTSIIAYTYPVEIQKCQDVLQKLFPKCVNSTFKGLFTRWSRISRDACMSAVERAEDAAQYAEEYHRQRYLAANIFDLSTNENFKSDVAKSRRNNELAACMGTMRRFLERSGWVSELGTGCTPLHQNAELGSPDEGFLNSNTPGSPAQRTE